MDVFVLEEITEHHYIDSRWFIPFTIYRLQPVAIDRSVVFEVTLQDFLQEPVVTRQLQLTWQTEPFTVGARPVQEHIVTEWAACGIASVVISFYAHLQILQVAQTGDRFDYWIGNNVQELGLEVSGTTIGDLEQRQRRKARQLRSNPYAVDGFVSVTDFRTQRTVLSFHSFQ